jgi:hypothetical protein
MISPNFVNMLDMLYQQLTSMEMTTMTNDMTGRAPAPSSAPSGMLDFI